jgi:hypothetical protein
VALWILTKSDVDSVTSQAGSSQAVARAVVRRLDLQTAGMLGLLSVGVSNLHWVFGGAAGGSVTRLPDAAWAAVPATSRSLSLVEDRVAAGEPLWRQVTRCRRPQPTTGMYDSSGKLGSANGDDVVDLARGPCRRGGQQGKPSELPAATAHQECATSCGQGAAPSTDSALGDLLPDHGRPRGRRPA